MNGAEASWMEHFNEKTIARLNLVVKGVGLGGKNTEFTVLQFEEVEDKRGKDVKQEGFRCC